MLLAASTCKPALSGAASQCSASTCCRSALAAARASTPERAEFRRDDLDAWGLAGPVQLEKAAQVRTCGCKRALCGLQACSQRLLLDATLHAVLVSGALWLRTLFSSEKLSEMRWPGSRLLCLSDAYPWRHCRLRGLQGSELGPKLCAGGCSARSWASGSATAGSCCAC